MTARKIYAKMEAHAKMLASTSMFASVHPVGAAKTAQTTF